jgi:hypothetical protein
VTTVKSGWRGDDEALLLRLEDELLLERVWTAFVGVHGPSPHPRASGTISAMRERVDGAVAVERALRGDVGPLVRALSDPDPKSLGPRLAHHLAIFHGQVAAALERATGQEDGLQEKAERARLRSIAMWLWLAEEGAYVLRLADAVIAGALPPTEIARAGAEAPYEPIALLGERARAGARERTEHSRLALRALSRIGGAASAAGCGEKVRKQALRRAQRERSVAVDDAIARIDEGLAEAATRGASTAELLAWMTDADAVWRWTERDEQVEHFVVERITPFCWERYRERRWAELRSILQQIQELIDHLAKRIEGDPKKLAYAAPCAQMFVFRAEVSLTFDGQIELAERAIALCSTHRNGRLVLADLLVERGVRALDTAMPWSTGDALAKAEADIRRAADLFPGLKRLADAKQRLKAAGRDLDAA